MYWFKLKQLTIVALICGLFLFIQGSGCKPDIKETGSSLKYFDIKGYFTKEAARLTKQNKPILKTITYNGATESKKVLINNWGRELDFFASADINKPAWKDSYTIEKSGNFLIYKAKYPELKMREMVIKKDSQKIDWILIYNSTKNLLYQSTEKLSYFPDSLYIIEKLQRVILLGTNIYRVKGTIGR